MAFPTKRNNASDDFPLCSLFAPPSKTQNFIFIVVSPSLSNTNVCVCARNHFRPHSIFVQSKEKPFKKGLPSVLSPANLWTRSLVKKVNAQKSRGTLENEGKNLGVARLSAPNRALPFASNFYRRGYRREFRGEDHFYPFLSQKISWFASDSLHRSNRASLGLKRSRGFPVEAN